MKHIFKVMLAVSLAMLISSVYAREEIRSVYDGKSDVAAWQKDARKKLAKILGYDKIIAEPLCDLNPQTLWKRKVENGTIEKIRLQIDPGFASSIYLCIPDKAAAPHKVFICLQGHSTGMHVSIGMDWKDETKPIAVKGDRDFAVYCMKRGIPVICFEQRAMGENSPDQKKRSSGCRLANFNAVLRGRSIIGYRVFDIKRVVDYIKSRPDFFDGSHIGIVGNSGGGTTAMFAGAMLPELTHIMPSSCFSTFRHSIYDRKHCFCNYIPKLLVYGESADVLGLIAPRPLVIVNGKKDRSFPLGPARDQFKRIKKIYQKLGAGGNCHHVIGQQGHQFYADQAWEVMLPLWNK